MSDFIEEAIKAAAVELNTTSKDTNIYLCELTSLHGAMTRNITMKPGYDAPALGGLLYHYALIAQTMDEYDDILDWADDEKVDPGDTGVQARFTQMLEDQRDLRLLLSEPIYQDMMMGLAISQAIGNARPREC